MNPRQTKVVGFDAPIRHEVGALKSRVILLEGEAEFMKERSARHEYMISAGLALLAVMMSMNVVLAGAVGWLWLGR